MTANLIALFGRPPATPHIFGLRVEAGADGTVKTVCGLPSVLCPFVVARVGAMQFPNSPGYPGFKYNKHNIE